MPKPPPACRMVPVVCLMAMLAGCAQIPRSPVPARFSSARLIDPDRPPGEYAPIDPHVLPKLEEIVQAHWDESVKEPPLNMLALSGGGMYGAFDVGVLCGWSASGKRPTFDVVTGISTGALIATFAFLGPQYDDLLRDSYIHTSSDDVLRMKPVVAAVFSDSLASSAPLQSRVEAAITPDVLQEVAAAHAAGRRLYVGTTNLDTRRLVVWDMGAIAARGTPEALDLYRKVVLASASVPGLFPPVTIDVEVDGRTYSEMHVDGGASASVFLGAFMLKADPHNFRSRAGSNLYVITSGKLYADGEGVRPTLKQVSAAAISSMLYAANRSDLYRLFCLALVSGVNFNLLAVPQDFPLNPNGLCFDREEMTRLFEVGRRLGYAGNAWRHTPPGVEPTEQSLPRTGVRFVTEPSGPPQGPAPGGPGQGAGSAAPSNPPQP
jgi:Patatin-like phospholipase